MKGSIVAQAGKAPLCRQNDKAADASVTVSSTAVTLADLGITLHAETTEVRLSVQDQAIHVTYDGVTTPVGSTVPANGVGEHWAAGYKESFPVEVAKKMQFVRDGASNARLTVIQFSR